MSAEQQHTSSSPTLSIAPRLAAYYDELHLDIPLMTDYLIGREMPPDIIASQTLALRRHTLGSLVTRFAADGSCGDYRQKTRTAIMYPYTVSKYVVYEYLANTTGDPGQADTLDFDGNTENLLNDILTHELEHAIDFSQAEDYRGSTQYKIESTKQVAAAIGPDLLCIAGIFGVGLPALREAVEHTQGPELSWPIQLYLQAFSLATTYLTYQRLSAIGASMLIRLHEDNVYEQRAHEAEKHAPNFFTVRHSKRARDWAQRMIEKHLGAAGVNP